MFDFNNFDANEVNPNEGFEAIPVGDYEVMMIKNEAIESTAKPGNHYENCSYKIVSGAYAGRVLFDKLYLHYKNPEAVSLARSRLSSICHGTGIMKLKGGLFELHNAKLIAKVGIEKYEGEDKNKIIKFDKRPSSLQNQTQETQQVEAGRVEGGEEKPEWQK